MKAIFVRAWACVFLILGSPELMASEAPAITSIPKSIFISGHSLTDRPIPDYLAHIAKSMGTSLEWNRQYVVGSPIIVRARGRNRDLTGWAGYRSGFNRDGQGLDVVEELRRPKTIAAGRYDVLLITEQHGLLDSLTWNDTVRYLRHYHDRFIDGNPQGVTYFYESWLSLDDKTDPQRWIAYERDASPIWQCIATRINVSLAAEQRADRIRSLPAGIALAELIDHATRSPGLPGITRKTVRETVDSLIADQVHPTNLGRYYVALVSYATIYGRSPVGAWRPDDVDATQADSLQRLAWEFVSDYRQHNVPLTLAQCRVRLKESFVDEYAAYVRDTFWKPTMNPLQVWWRWARSQWTWRHMASSESTRNPFYFDPTTDRSYWLPAP